METPLVSVIVPVYNAEKHIKMLVDSVLAQSFADFELLLIDDGSTDSTPYVLDQYAEQDNRVRVIHKVNGGVSSARNCGLDNARGTYIAFADNDDYMYPDNLETMVEEAQGMNYDLIICDFIRCRREEIGNFNNNRAKTYEVTACNMDEMPAAVTRMGYRNFVIWNQLFKHKLIIEHNIRFRNYNSEDEMFATEFFVHVESFKRLDYKGYVFIYNQNSQGSSHKYIATYDWIVKMESLYDIIIKKYSLQGRYVHTYNWRIANRLSVLCMKGYYNDSHLSWHNRMAVWMSVKNDKWLNNRILPHNMGRNIRIILFVAKHNLFYLLDPFFCLYGKFKS